MTMTVFSMRRVDPAQAPLAAYSHVHWERTKISCYRTALLLTFATIWLTFVA
jgi:hypothetical protein